MMRAVGRFFLGSVLGSGKQAIDPLVAAATLTKEQGRQATGSKAALQILVSFCAFLSRVFFLPVATLCKIALTGGEGWEGGAVAALVRRPISATCVGIVMAIANWVRGSSFPGQSAVQRTSHLDVCWASSVAGLQ